MKQRLIGTIVLGCLALIFIPILLDGEGVQEPSPLSITVPPAPEITITPLPEPERPIILSDTNALDITNTTTTAVPQALVVSPEANSPAPVGADAVPAPVVEQVERKVEPKTGQQASLTAPRLTTQGLPEGFSVKLGTFGDRSNAEALVASLILENYKAYSRPVQSGSQAMLAVYVGPVLTQAEANTLRQQLLSNPQLKDAVVVPFVIDTPAQGQ
jgi:DedD protein